ncbi:hypothetical protein GCM10018952_54800 [Streptosporangium vulgare]
MPTSSRAVLDFPCGKVTTSAPLTTRHHGRVGDLHHPRDGHPERVGDAGERADARVRPALLDLDEHAPAHSRARGELVEGHLPVRPLRPHVVGDRGGDRLWIHEFSVVNSICTLLHFIYCPVSTVY